MNNSQIRHALYAVLFARASFALALTLGEFGWNDHWMSFGVEDKDIGRFSEE